MSNSQNKNSSNGKMPVHEIRMGRVKAAIWANESENGVRHNVSISRLYRTENGQWKDSSSFGRDDLPLIARVSDLAHLWIFEATGAMAGTH